MTQARDMYELDARSGAFVNDTLPGADGSVLGANTAPETTADGAKRASYALTTLRNRGGVWGAAVGGGLLALGLAYIGRRLWARPSRMLFGIAARRRPRGWGFSR